MNTPFDTFKTWTAFALEDARMSIGILAIWLASAMLPSGHPSQVHLRDAVRVME